MNTTTTTQSAASFRRQAERAFRNANPDAVGVGVSITWTWTSRPCAYPSGRGQFRTGRFAVSAPGFRSREMIASANVNGTGMVVR